MTQKLSLTRARAEGAAGRTLQPGAASPQQPWRTLGQELSQDRTRCLLASRCTDVPHHAFSMAIIYLWQCLLAISYFQTFMCPAWKQKKSLLEYGAVGSTTYTFIQDKIAPATKRKGCAVVKLTAWDQASVTSIAPVASGTPGRSQAPLPDLQPSS